VVEWWSDGVMEWWNGGMVERWRVECLETSAREFNGTHYD
jgi:hypothetical protein